MNHHTHGSHPQSSGDVERKAVRHLVSVNSNCLKKWRLSFSDTIIPHNTLYADDISNFSLLGCLVCVIFDLFCIFFNLGFLLFCLVTVVIISISLW